jgi:acetyl-CoA acetyltransferase
MVKSRHMYQYGTTNAQFAHISVATRRHATRNPEAVQAMTDLEFVGVREITVDDVLSSRTIAHPLRLLECCMSPTAVARWSLPPRWSATPQKPVWIIGSGKPPSIAPTTPYYRQCGAQSGPIAFSDAGFPRRDRRSHGL